MIVIFIIAFAIATIIVIADEITKRSKTKDSSIVEDDCSSEGKNITCKDLGRCYMGISDKYDSITKNELYWSKNYDSDVVKGRLHAEGLFKSEFLRIPVLKHKEELKPIVIMDKDISKQIIKLVDKMNEHREDIRFREIFPDKIEEHLSTVLLASNTDKGLYNRDKILDMVSKYEKFINIKINEIEKQDEEARIKEEKEQAIELDKQIEIINQWIEDAENGII